MKQQFNKTENIGRICYVEALVPHKASSSQDSMKLMIIGESTTHYVVMASNSGDEWTIKKSAVTFEDRVMATMPKSYRKLIGRI